MRVLERRRGRDVPVRPGVIPPTLLKRVRIRRRTCLDREEARRDVLITRDVRQAKSGHGYAGGLAPAEFEQLYFNRLERVQGSRGDSPKTIRMTSSTSRCCADRLNRQPLID